jgi:hypothetical protein
MRPQAAERTGSYSKPLGASIGGRAPRLRLTGPARSVNDVRPLHVATLIGLLCSVAVAQPPAPAAPPAPRAAPTTATANPRLDVVLPVPPVEHERLYYFSGGAHHLVPGAVSIDGPPYVCDLDHLTFADRERFVLHLRTVHRISPDRIRDGVMVVDGRVHYVGD